MPTLRATLPLVVTALLLLNTTTTVRAAENSCSSAYWNKTLRCRALAAWGLSDPPQPNESDAPANAAQVKQYTRVFLDTGGVRCVDGTRPTLYVDPAVCTTIGGCTQPDGTTVALGADMVSNKWLISMGSCNAFDTDGDGRFEDGSRCTDLYPSEVNEMSSAFDAPMKNLTSAPGGSSGIMSPDPSENPVFAGYNRVRVEKCSYDRYLGRASGSHEGAYGDDGFHDTSISDAMSSISMRQWLEGFIAAPATNTTAARIDGSSLGTAMTSSCPP